MPSIRSVTRKPPTTLIVPKAIAITSSRSSRKPSAGPITIRPPSSTIPWIALVPLISGVWSVFGTFEITSKPTNAASARIASSVSRSIRHLLGARVHDLAAARDARAGDHLVLEVQLQRGVLARHQLEQAQHVAT